MLTDAGCPSVSFSLCNHAIEQSEMQKNLNSAGKQMTFKAGVPFRQRVLTDLTSDTKAISYMGVHTEEGICSDSYSLHLCPLLACRIAVRRAVCECVTSNV
jgi:hypothetical protein